MKNLILAFLFCVSVSLNANSEEQTIFDNTYTSNYRPIVYFDLSENKLNIKDNIYTLVNNGVILKNKRFYRRISIFNAIAFKVIKNDVYVLRNNGRIYKNDQFLKNVSSSAVDFDIGENNIIYTLNSSGQIYRGTQFFKKVASNIVRFKIKGGLLLTLNDEGTVSRNNKALYSI